MCGRVIQSSGPLRLAIVEGLDVSESRMGNVRPRYNASRVAGYSATSTPGPPIILARKPSRATKQKSRKKTWPGLRGLTSGIFNGSLTPEENNRLWRGSIATRGYTGPIFGRMFGQSRADNAFG
jgi:hypothetical protein